MKKLRVDIMLTKFKLDSGKVRCTREDMTYPTTYDV